MSPVLDGWWLFLMPVSGLSQKWKKKHMILLSTFLYVYFPFDHFYREIPICWLKCCILPSRSHLMPATGNDSVFKCLLFLESVNFNVTPFSVLSTSFLSAVSCSCLSSTNRLTNKCSDLRQRASVTYLTVWTSVSLCGSHTPSSYKKEPHNWFAVRRVRVTTGGTLSKGGVSLKKVQSYAFIFNIVLLTLWSWTCNSKQHFFLVSLLRGSEMSA